MAYTKKNAPILSMAWEEDYNGSASPTNPGVWDTSAIEVADHSGMGRLFNIGIHADTTRTTHEIRIVADGNEHVLAKTDIEAIHFMHSVSAAYASIPFSLEFDTSLNVQISRNGDTNDLYGWVSCGILSEEFSREIILAGQPIPDRSGHPRLTASGQEKTYPYDVLLVWFRGRHGISNKVVHPRGEILDIEAGQLFDTAFNIDLSQPRFIRTPSAATKIKKAIIDGQSYNIQITAGVVELASVPSVITAEAFWDRFTVAEQETLVTHSNAKVQAFLYQLRLRPKINLRNNKLITSIEGMETFGILNSGRATEILSV